VQPDAAAHGGHTSLPRPSLLPRKTSRVAIPQAALAGAEKLINECGYHHRDEELGDANERFLRMERKGHFEICLDLE